jgi:hypothetical protein
MTDLHWVSYNGCILTLLNSYANFNLQNNEGQTPLDLATGNKIMIEQWIEDHEVPIRFSKEPVDH